MKMNNAFIVKAIIGAIVGAIVVYQLKKHTSGIVDD
jgi:hypothetical protein